LKVEARKSVGINSCWMKTLVMELLCKSIPPKDVFSPFQY